MIVEAVGGSTRVTFPRGAVSGTSPVVAVEPLSGGGFGVVTRVTPFHPLDHSWPDQPGDFGVLYADGLRLRVVDCLTGAVPVDGGDLTVGEEIPARRGDGGWDWLVVHMVERSVPVGVKARLEVDAARRRALSVGHTACHLMALALNAALATRWRKAARLDGLGRPDFDQLAIASSRIVMDGSRDVYRIGRSLRRKGFVADGLAETIGDVQNAVNETLAKWTAEDAPVRVTVPAPELSARRIWRCELDEGVVEIPCGGTHVRRTGVLASVTVSLELAEDELVAETRAVDAGRVGNSP
jgi:alanyl-tRNA synthetase